MTKPIINTPIEGYTIRFANASDSSLILDFIRQLANYEKLAHEVVATEKQLQKHLFGDNPKAEVLIGEDRNTPVSFALFFHNFSTFLAKPGIYLEDLFVKPEARGKGFGKVMLACLAHLAKQRECGRLEWWVLNWNNPAITFYEKLGAEAMDEWTTYRITGKSLNELASHFDLP